MEIEKGKTYYCPFNYFLFRVKGKKRGRIYGWEREFYQADLFDFSSGIMYENDSILTDSDTLKNCVLLNEDPDKPSPFDKAKKAYDTYMATIRAIEQQVKDNINQQTK